MPERIDVTFGVEVPLDEVAEIKAQLEELRPGSTTYVDLWDRLKSMERYYAGRLEGECQAYMNIARERLKGLFTV